MRVLPLLANAGFAAAGAASALRFRRALTRPRPTQERLLRGYLHRNAETAFGRGHRFDTIDSFEAFQARVPARGYDEYAPYVDRIAAGEPGVLTAEPVEVLEWSSGSTRAAKLVPFNRTLRAEFARAVAAWVTHLFFARPSLAAGPAYWSVSPAADPPEVEGCVVPIGPLEDAEYLGGRLARLVEATLAVPGALARLRDPEEHRRLTLVHLLGCAELRLVSVWHPSYLALLLDAMRSGWEDLLREVATGVRVDALGLAVPARPGRARTLERVGPENVRAIWPRLGLVSCWADGPAHRPATALAARLPGVTLQPKGLLATEGVVSIPIGARRPLAITSHVVELVDDAGVAHPAWAVDRGGTYTVLLTTGGGLYRYRLHDRVRVTDLLGRTPCIEFVGKEDHVSDRFGEKLSQGFVQGVVDRVLARHDLAGARFAMLAPEEEAGSRYVLYVSEPVVPRAADPESDVERSLAEDLERELGRNPHYAHCRRLGQLGSAEIAPVPADAERRYLERLVAEGRRAGDVKPTALSPLLGWGAALGGTGSGAASGRP